MDADAFMSVTEAVEAGAHSVQIPVNYPPGITKLVWSVWDYVLGPDLKFVWEVVPAELATFDLTSANSVSSSDSGGPRFEFDNDFQGELFTETAQVHCCGLCLRRNCNGSCRRMSGDVSPLAHLRISPADPMTDSQSTLRADTATTDETTSSDEMNIEDGPLSGLKLSLQSDTNLELSPLRRTERRHSEIVDKSNGESRDRKVSKTLSLDSSVTVLTDDGSAYEAVSGPPSNQMSSASDSFTSNLAEVSEEETVHEWLEGQESQSSNNRTSSQSSEFDLLNDEMYAATHSLSSELYRAHMPDSAVDAKLLCVPARKLLIGAYIFVAKNRDTHKAVHSFALLMPEDRMQWYLLRMAWFKRVFVDLVPRIKAALLVENSVEVLSRMTTEWTLIFNLLANLEHWSLNSRLLKVQDSLLWLPKLSDDNFVQRCISAHMQAQGHTVVIGADIKKIRTIMQTLCLFLPSEERWCTMQPFLSPYCPYLRLQGLPKGDLSSVLSQGCHSWWPIAVIDVDQSLVFLSSPYSQHRIMKINAQKHDLRHILGQMTQSKAPKLDLKTVSTVDPMVKDLVKRMDLLPFDSVVRLGFVSQWLRFHAQRALALIALVQEQTDQGRSAGDLRLRKVRKALDLSHDGEFHCVLAMAERMRPGLAELIFS